jgi:predicted RNA polymerase sigma factor
MRAERNPAFKPRLALNCEPSLQRSGNGLPVGTKLAAVVRSPVIELNRAIAVSMAESPQAGLAIVDGLLGEPALKSYHLLPSVRGDLLHKLGRHEEARVAFEEAAALAGNRREHDLLI